MPHLVYITLFGETDGVPLLRSWCTYSKFNNQLNYVCVCVGDREKDWQYTIMVSKQLFLRGGKV